MDERSLVPRAVVRTGALARAGDAAVFASDEFFGARIRNPHTRRAYGRAVARFLAWVEAEGVELARVDAGDGGPVPGHAEPRAGGEATGALGLPAVLRRPGPAPRSAVATHIVSWDPSSRVVPIAMGPQSSTEDGSCGSP